VTLLSWESREAGVGGKGARVVGGGGTLDLEEGGGICVLGLCADADGREGNEVSG
jgi:hypothetical protein